MHTRIAHVAHASGGASSSWWSPPTAAPATSASATSSPSSSAELLSYTKICEPGGRGLLLPLLAAENELPYGPRVPLYLLELLWLFFGVAIVADIFMAAIEQITSQEKKVTLMVRGEWTSYYVRVWNPTVANLSLMALGSSAPEIMLSVIELFSNGMHTGELGRLRSSAGGIQHADHLGDLHPRDPRRRDALDQGARRVRVHRRLVGARVSLADRHPAVVEPRPD